MYEWILFVLIVALLLYVILAGADFGAGILELFTSRKYREEMEGITYQAIGPVWEANHIWLILIIVILFNGFPKTYALISTYLHLPIMLMLIGIVFRGTAFAFRHYDAIRDRSHRVYSSAFTMASFLTPLFLGSIAGATILGRLRTTPTDFLSGYIWPWFNPFSLSLGLMTSALFAFLAATFLIGETEDGSNLQQRVIRQAVMALGATVLLGGVVFLSGELAGFSLAGRFLEHPLSLIGVGLATLGLGLFLAVLRKKRWHLLRIVAGGLASLIVLSWIAAQYPVAIRLADGEHLTLHATRAPDLVMTILGYGLIFGVLSIFPALFFLIKTFKYRS